MIKHFIIHEIIKSKGTKTAVFSPSKKEVTLDSVAETLVNELHEAVTKSPKKAFGHFSDAGTSYFRQEIDNYLSSNSQYNLLVKSKAFLGDTNGESLISLLKDETLSTGGHVLIIDYSIDRKPYIIITMMNNKKGRALNIENGVPKIINTEQIDFQALDIACRIDINEYRKIKNDRNYICFISGREIIAQYFIKFIGCEKFNQNRDNSRKLVDIIRNISENMEDREEIKKRAYEYCKARHDTDNVIDLYELSDYIFGKTGKDKIVDFAKNNNVIIDHCFSIYKAEMDRFINFKFKGDWLDSLRFDRNNIKSNIVVKESDNSVVLKNVPHLIMRLRDEF